MAADAFRIDDWQVEPATGSLTRGDEQIRLEPKVMAVLLELAGEAGEMVSKEELIERVWPEAYVGEAALARCISELRRALGDDARDPRYIETLHKRGYRLLAPVEPIAPRAPEEAGPERVPPRVRWNHVAAGLLVALLFVAWWTGRPADDGRVESLAVLPLRALTDDPGARALAEGLTHQLVTELASIASLRVRSTGVLAGREAPGQRSLREWADELEVDALVTGTVQMSGNRTLIGLELVDGGSEIDLWAGNYQEIDEDPLEIEREVAEQATREIAALLAPGDVVERPVDPAARRALERGRMLAARDRPADALRALEHFQEALRIDPDYALAWAAAADQHATLGWHLWSPPEEAYRQAREAAYAALDLDPRLPEAHAVLGAVAAEANWDWPEAERFFEKAVELGPNSARAHERYARFLRRQGRWAEALEQSGRAVELDPDWLDGQVSHGWNLLLAGEADAARRAFLETLEMDDDLAEALAGLCAHAVLHGEPQAAVATCRRAADAPGQDAAIGGYGHALAIAGRTVAAERLLGQLPDRLGERPATALAEARVLTGLGRASEAIGALERAVAGRALEAAAVLADPFLRPLAGEPGFRALLERMAIPTAEAR